MHPNTTEKRTATDIVSQQHKASETGEANRVLINKNRCPQQDSSSTPAASRARRSLGPAPSLAAAQYGAYPVTPGLSGYARTMRLHQGYAATPGLCGYTRAMRLHQGYPRLPVPAILRVLRRCAARRCALVSFAALRAALILRAPLLIRLRFATDPSGWRPRYHPLRFARIIRCAPRRAARDARTASRMPVSWRDSLRADKA